MNKKSLSKTLIWALAVCLILLIACTKAADKQISLLEASENSNKVKSGSHVGDTSIKLESSKEEFKNFPPELITTIKGNFRLSETEMKYDGLLKVAAPDMNFESEMPLKYNLKGENEGEVFLGITPMIKQVFQLEDDKKYLYVDIQNAEDLNVDTDSGDIEKYMDMDKEITKIVLDFEEKHDGVLTFESFENKPTNENGKYTFNLNKELSQEFLNEILSNELVLEYIKNSSIANLSSSEENNDDIAKEFIEKTKDVDVFSTNIEFIIQDSILNNVKTFMMIESKDIKVAINMNNKIENINKEVEINLPSKDDADVVDFNKLSKSIGQ